MSFRFEKWDRARKWKFPVVPEEQVPSRGKRQSLKGDRQNRSDVRNQATAARPDDPTV
ncbi:hypothetical protein [Planctomicrobium sp. SH527]|uniref:hypothetical protein n=1 Tax=Planctomicrobium sp. SH527 TaxID=3448123 RepID=UPI003F5BF643